MPIETNRMTDNPVEKDQSVTAEKLPYVKPEIHLLDLESTEGKSNFSTKEFTSGGRDFGPS